MRATLPRLAAPAATPKRLAYLNHLRLGSADPFQNLTAPECVDLDAKLLKPQLFSASLIDQPTVGRTIALVMDVLSCKTITIWAVVRNLALRMVGFPERFGAAVTSGFLAPVIDYRHIGSTRARHVERAERWRPRRPSWRLR